MADEGRGGPVVELERVRDGHDEVERVVVKTFHAQYLNQLRTDDVTRRDHHANLAAMARMAALDHPNILPTYVSAPIGDNYLFVTPLKDVTLLEAALRAGRNTLARALAAERTELKRTSPFNWRVTARALKAQGLDDEARQAIANADMKAAVQRAQHLSPPRELAVG